MNIVVVVVAVFVVVTYNLKVNTIFFWRTIGLKKLNFVNIFEELQDIHRILWTYPMSNLDFGLKLVISTW